MRRLMSVSILMVGSEALPFSKTGGLADVLGALPLALGKLGHRVTLVTPKYRGVQAMGRRGSIQVAGVGGAVAETRVDRAAAGREREGGARRSSRAVRPRHRFMAPAATIRTTRAVSRFSAWAALEYALQSGESFDILHAHDWQAGLAPVYLRTRYAASRVCSGMTADLHDSQSRLSGKLSRPTGSRRSSSASR